ncbi:MAG TPA: hypothetical protein VI037_04405 [Nitrososphaera sp.]
MPFRNALDKSERNEFDDMFYIPRLYLSAYSNSVQLVPLHPIIISTLFHHYKELKQCTEEVKHIEATTSNMVNNDTEEKKKELTEEGVEKEKEVVLDLSTLSP